MSNLAYLNQHINIETSHGSRNHHIVPDTTNITFNLEIESTDKTHIVNNIGRELTNKEVQMLGLKEQRKLMQLTTQISMALISKEAVLWYTIIKWFRGPDCWKKSRCSNNFE